MYFGRVELFLFLGGYIEFLHFTVCVTKVLISLGVWVQGRPRALRVTILRCMYDFSDLVASQLDKYGFDLGNSSVSLLFALGKVDW